MAFSSWCSRRVGGLSFITLLALCAVVIISEYQVLKTPPGPTRASGRLLTVFFAYYSLIIHLVVSIFPFRACWAIWDITRSLKKVAPTRQWRDLGPERKLSTYSLSSTENLTPSRASATSSDTEDCDAGYFADVEAEIPQHFHAILIPNYKEDVDVLRETLDVLASHPQARSQYNIFLAMEAREVNSDVKAVGLIAEYVKKFHAVDFTLHPADLPRDSPGKSSNISWAARKASERYMDVSRDDVIVTVIDADSHLSASYFEEVSGMHLRYPKTSSTTVYTPPIIFDRNAHLVPILVRVADIQWCAAGLSGLYAGSWVGPPTSVYSLPLGLADKVGGWDADCEAIGEDLHMYLKCFFALNGNLTRRTVLSPASQTNVSVDLKGPRGIAGGVQARYKQGLRHMWGSLDSGYALRQLVSVWRDRKCRIRTFRPLHTNGNHKTEYIPDADLENLLKNQIAMGGAFSDVRYHRVDPPSWPRIFFLLHRLLEAHFFPTHMMILIISSGIYTFIADGQPDELQIAWTFELAGYLRFFGFSLVALYFALYETFHRDCVNTRKAEMKAAGLYDHMQTAFSYRTFWGNILDYFMVPIAAPLFGSIPAIQAQVSHFWTLDLIYTVSKKPSNKRDAAGEC